MLPTTETHDPDATDMDRLLADPEVVSNWVLEKYPAFAQAVLADLVNNSDVLKVSFEADNALNAQALSATRARAAVISRRLALGLEVPA